MRAFVVCSLLHWAKRPSTGPALSGFFMDRCPIVTRTLDTNAPCLAPQPHSHPSPILQAPLTVATPTHEQLRDPSLLPRPVQPLGMPYLSAYQ